VHAGSGRNRPVHGQEPDGPAPNPPGEGNPGVVLNLGGGVGSQGSAGILSLGIPVGPGELVLRSAGTASINFFRPSEATGDLGLLYGVRKAGARGWTRVAGRASSPPGDPARLGIPGRTVTAVSPELTPPARRPTTPRG
jgi:hypothetical protein